MQVYGYFRRRDRRYSDSHKIALSRARLSRSPAKRHRITSDNVERSSADALVAMPIKSAADVVLDRVAVTSKDITNSVKVFKSVLIYNSVKVFKSVLINNSVLGLIISLHHRPQLLLQKQKLLKR